MTDLDFRTIGRKIKNRRQFLNITQDYIANQLDVNASHISNIECGRAHPSLTALIKIANLLHCSVDCFINEEYTYITDAEESELDLYLNEKIQTLDMTQKKKIIKIIDILNE